MHADHITGTGVLKKLSGCKSLISKASGAQADIHVDENDVITFGRHTLKIFSTPGHTNGCLTYYSPEQVNLRETSLPNQKNSNNPRDFYVHIFLPFYKNQARPEDILIPFILQCFHF